MEEKTRSLTMQSLYYGLITGAVMIVFSLVLYLLDLIMNKYLGYVNLAFLTGGLFYAAFEYRNKFSNGFMTYGKALKSTFLTGLFASILNAVYTFILYSFIAPDLIQTIIEKGREEMIAKNPNMSEEQIEQGVAMIEKFTGPISSSIMVIIMLTLFSLIIGLVLALFLKKEDPTQSTY